MTRKELRGFRQEIAALEKRITAACGAEDMEVKADQNDDAMANNPVPEAAFNEFNKGSIEPKAPVAASKKAAEEPKVEEKKPEEVKASEPVKTEDAEDDWNDEDWDTDDAVEPKKEEVVGGVAENIKDTHDQVIDIVNPSAKGQQPIDTVKKLKTACERLDKIAAYCEKNGESKIAFEIDKIADAIDAQINSITSK